MLQTYKKFVTALDLKVVGKKFQMILDKGAQPEMWQVSMKVFKEGLDALVDGFKPTAHPVAVKRIADLQEQGYIY